MRYKDEAGVQLPDKRAQERRNDGGVVTEEARATLDFPGVRTELLTAMARTILLR